MAFRYRWRCTLPDGSITYSAHPMANVPCVLEEEPTPFDPGPFDEGDAEDPPEDPPPKQYEIRLPNLTEFIKFPAKEANEAKKKKIAALLRKKSPVPESLQWIPGVINILDDAQDLLITGLTVAKPLLRRLPLRFVPYLGWALLVNDVLNVGTALFGTALAGRSAKKALLSSMEIFYGRRARRLKRVNDFFSRTPILPTVLQAGQASTTLTGYGLTLGAYMGFITDTIWGTVRSLQGADIVIKQNPDKRLDLKGHRFLIQSPMRVLFPDLFTKKEHEYLNAATALATISTQDHASPALANARASELNSFQMPAFEPWNESSQQFLTDAGIPWEYSEENKLIPLYLEGQKQPVISDILRATGPATIQWEDRTAQNYKTDTHGSTLQVLHNIPMLDNWRWQGDDPLNIVPEFTDFEKDLGSAVEFSVFPPNEVEPQVLARWLANARIQSLIQGYTRASFEALKATAITDVGGFVRRRYETFPEEDKTLPWPKFTGELWRIQFCDNEQFLAWAVDARSALVIGFAQQQLHPERDVCLRDPDGTIQRVRGFD